MKRRGFTLMEVLIAILVLGLAIVGIMPLLTVALRAHKRALDNATANTIFRQVTAELQEQLTDPNLANVTDQPVPGFPDSFRYDAVIQPAETNDPAQSGFRVDVTVRWTYERRENTWPFSTFMFRQLDHSDWGGARPGLTRRKAPAKKPEPVYRPDPVVEFGEMALKVVAKSRYQPPPMDRIMEVVVETLDTPARTSVGGWDIKQQVKGKNGVSILLVQPIKGEKTREGRFIYAVGLSAIFFPMEKTGLTDPRIIHFVKRDTKINGKKSDVNSHGWRPESPKAQGEPWLSTQRPVDRDPRGAGTPLGKMGVLAWEAPGVSQPWEAAQDFSLDARWQGRTWVVCKRDGTDQPVGYFNWSISVTGKVKLGPTDSTLKVRLQANAWIDSTGAGSQGAELRRYLR